MAERGKGAHLLDALRERRQALGLPATMLLVLARAMRLVSRRWRLVFYHIVVQPLPASADTGSRAPGKYRFELLEGPAPVLAELGRPEAVIRRRFAGGSRCLVATRDGRFAGCLWFQTGAYEEDEVHCLFELAGPEIAWDYDVYVAPAERLGILFARLWQRAAAIMREQGIRYTASRISGFNEFSLASHRRLGAVTVRRVVYLVFWRAQLTVSARWPLLHLCFGPRRRPVLRVAPPRGDR